MASHTAGSGNPFGIPGLQLPGSDGNIANPVLQSMEMLRQVWGSLGALPQAAPISPAMGLDDLDRRINDLRAVENWLNLNLTMLRGTIQGLEVQRATISTLRSFAQTASEAYGGGDADAPPSPLEVALGLRPAPAKPAAKPAGQDKPDAAPKAGDQAQQASAKSAEAPAANPSAANPWWNMLQDQFNRMATAAAASMPTPPAAGTKADKGQAAAAAKPAAKRTGTASRARKPKARP
ncbi:transcriptional regulator [Pigmentiphaga sp. GD03639]|uniref:PhaM family polyhydroxyalkanoate granule multifunctional regulatory protein n=1 Tax=Pigmentiphaga sp. GD03639 TaxID=2975354 RepID=UPI002448DB51|nr:PhaM family polyhydroxyalkanoate granule multifunctional regulatory protein [Pigmentiphaga sp. GD03639]MDH2236286.1 transcriptional regulator [Pigmentiphaga sp. GD03639]